MTESTDDVAGGNDRVGSFLSYTLGFGLEKLSLAGDAAINGTGNEKDNEIFGNTANNVLSGLDGNDELFGSGGNDQVFGGAGNDNLGGGDGADQLLGGTGNDVLFDGGVDGGNDLLDGGAGADNMTGNDGSDTYIVDDAGDVPFEIFDEGVDLVRASVTYALDHDVENLTLTGSAAIDGGGNELRNVITGNSANNVLSGLDGNDQLNGGTGNDLLIGGTGADTQTGGLGTDIFRYLSVSDTPSGSGRDIITDFGGAGAAVGDRIDLSGIDANALVAGNQAFTYIGSAAFTAAGQLRYNTTSGILSGSTDADAASEFQIQLIGTPTLVIGGAGTDVIL